MTIYCVAKNYRDHAKEMGGDAPAEPTWFLKPDASIGTGTVELPPIGEVHHEVEWAIRLGDNGPEAMTVALDITARDLQAAAKAAGRPWTQAKGYRTFTQLGPWLPFAPGPHALRLSVNGEVRQDGTTADMVHDLRALLAHLHTWTDLQLGDIILTGTPAGVGPLRDGDRLEAACGGASTVCTVIAKR